MFDRPQQATLDDLLEHPADPVEAGMLIEAITGAARRENQDAAARLTAIGGLYGLRVGSGGGTEQWALDTEHAVAAEVAAALRISHGAASCQVRYARAMRERLPAIGAVFRTGELDMRTFETLVFRTDLITDAEVLNRVDGQLAAAIPRLRVMSHGRLAAHIDRVVARLDPDAVRRRKDAAERREVWMTDRLDGMSELGGTVFSTTAHALDQRLDALAETVCPNDPRTKAQRRADAIEALAAGADRMSCRCGAEDCPAGGRVAGPVVIHIVSGGTADTQGSLIQADGLLPAELVEQLAEHAEQRPLIHPGDAPPERGYAPSRALADFVRCRDLTCRFPGCEQRATGCDIDHSIPHGDGGRTQASNLKCLCRLHHLLKTFWGWRDQQLRDGTVIWTSPSGDTYLTTPGSALLFPGLCAPTAMAVRDESPDPGERGGDRTAMMPRRRRTRAQNRAARVTAERQANQVLRQARRRRVHPYFQPIPATGPGDDPPPF